MPDLSKIMNIFSDIASDDEDETTTYPKMPSTNTIIGDDVEWVHNPEYWSGKSGSVEEIDYGPKDMNRWWRYKKKEGKSSGWKVYSQHEQSQAHTDMMASANETWDYAGYDMNEELWEGSDSAEKKLTDSLKKLSTVINNSFNGAGSTSFHIKPVEDLIDNLRSLEEDLTIFTEGSRDTPGLRRLYLDLDIPEGPMRGSSAAAFGARIFDLYNRLTNLQKQIVEHYDPLENVTAGVATMGKNIERAVDDVLKDDSSGMRRVVDNWYKHTSDTEQWRSDRGLFEFLIRDSDYGVIIDPPTGERVNRELKRRWKEAYGPAIRTADYIYETLKEKYTDSHRNLTKFEPPTGGTPVNMAPEIGDGDGLNNSPNGAGGPEEIKITFEEPPPPPELNYEPGGPEGQGGSANTNNPPLDFNGPGSDDHSPGRFIQGPDLGPGGMTPPPPPLDFNGPGSDDHSPGRFIQGSDLGPSGDDHTTPGRMIPPLPPLGLNGPGGPGRRSDGSPGLGTNFPPPSSVDMDSETGLPINPETGLPFPVDSETGLPYNPENGLPLSYDPVTGQVTPIDPITNLPVSPGSGTRLDMDSETGLPINPETGLPFPVDSETGLPYNPENGLPLNYDPVTGQVTPIDPITGAPTSSETLPPPPETNFPSAPGDGPAQSDSETGRSLTEDLDGPASMPSPPTPRTESEGGLGLNYPGLSDNPTSSITGATDGALGSRDLSSSFASPTFGGGAPSQAQHGGEASSMPVSPGHPGMSPPMMPPPGGGAGGGGGGGGGGDRERNRATWLSEDERVWGTDTSRQRSVLGRPASGQEKQGVPRHGFISAGTAASGTGTSSQEETGARGRKRKPGVGNRRGRGRDQDRNDDQGGDRGSG